MKKRSVKFEEAAMKRTYEQYNYSEIEVIDVTSDASSSEGETSDDECTSDIKQM